MKIEIEGVKPEASLFATLIRKRNDYYALARTADIKMIQSQESHGFAGTTLNELLLKNMGDHFRRVEVEVEKEIRELFPKVPSSSNSQS